MDPQKGYNKTSGGRNNYHVSMETRAKISASMKAMWERNPERRVEYSIRMSGDNNPMFGKTWSKTPEQVAKTSGENHGMFGKTGADHPAFGKTWSKTPEQVAKFSGENNHKSKPICVFGKVYPAASTASNTLRAEHAPNRKDNFINQRTRIKKHMPYTFYVTKEFYVHALMFGMENITRDFYENWL
jgi:hypothetical protein